jgi:hypothetical protein
MRALAVDGRVQVRREYVKVVFNGHQPDRAGDFWTDDVVWHGKSLGPLTIWRTVASQLGAITLPWAT